MARGYQTAGPSFIQDITYQPPWQFMQEALQSKQKGYDDVLQKTELIKNLLDVKHLNFEDDRAKNIKEYYNSRMDDLTNQLVQDPNNYNRVLPQLRNLTRELDTDRKEGNIAAIENRYNAVQNWMKENKDIREKEPDTYNRLFAHWYDDIKNRSSSDIKASYAGVKGIQRPDLEWEKIMKDIKENGFTDTDGKYYKSVEGVDPERIQNIAWNRLKSNPNFSGYINQMGNTLGMKSYFEKPFELRNQAGDIISSQDYQNMTDAQKKDIRRYVNSDNPFASDLEMATGVSAYQKSMRNKADEYGLKATDYKYDSALQAQKDKAALAKQAAKGDIDMKLLEKRYQLMGELEKQKAKAELETAAKEGDETAQKALQTLEGKETFGFISNNPLTYEDNLIKLQQGDAKAGQREQASRIYARSGLVKQGTKEHAFLEVLDDGLAKGKTKEQIMSEWLMSKVSGTQDVFSGGPTRYKPTSFYKDKYEKLMERYESKKSKYFQDHAKDVTEIALHAVTPQTSNVLANTINTNPDSYYTTDEEGNVISSAELPKVKGVLQAFGANPKEKVGVKVIFDDNSTGYILPKRSESGNVQTRAMKNLILDSGLAEPNSPLYKALKDEKLSDLKFQMDNAYPNPKTGNKEILYEVDGQKIPIHKIGREYYIVDPNNPRNATRIGEDLNKVIEEIYSN